MVRHVVGEASERLRLSRSGVVPTRAMGVLGLQRAVGNGRTGGLLAAQPLLGAAAVEAAIAFYPDAGYTPVTSASCRAGSVWSRPGWSTPGWCVPWPPGRPVTRVCHG